VSAESPFAGGAVLDGVKGTVVPDFAVDVLRVGRRNGSRV
jgi:hypothetical protein